MPLALGTSLILF